MMGMTMAILFSFVFLRDEIMHNGWNPEWMVLPVAQPADQPAAAPPPQPNMVAPPIAPMDVQNDIPFQEAAQDPVLANVAVQADLGEGAAAANLEGGAG